MEEVLDLYSQPEDPNYPLVCFDEASKQLTTEIYLREAAQPGKVAREDYQYERNGTANLFMFSAPLKGWRQVQVTDQRTQLDYAQQMKWLVDVAFPDAIQVRVVQDNLNTHVKASLYKAFEAPEARRILNRLDFHYTPKHGSWLNMAEIELSVLSRQCLDRRIPDKENLKSEIAAWEDRRNRSGNTIEWRFTTQDARIKLKHLYPSFQE
jgi:DDE superfamily endonuclease